MTNTSAKQLHLNRGRGMLGGVCAGLADYFNLPVLLVRVLFVIAFFTWPLTLLVYVVLYFCLSERPTRLGDLGDNLANSRVGRHLRSVDYKKGLYKSRHNKRIAGVCAGVANYLEINPFWIRLIAVLSLLFGPFAILAYVVAAVIMETDPNEAPNRSALGDHIDRSMRNGIHRSVHNRRQRRSGPTDYDRDVDAPTFSERKMRECSDKFSRLDARLQNLEATITSKRFKLHNEFKRMST